MRRDDSIDNTLRGAGESFTKERDLPLEFRIRLIVNWPLPSTGSKSISFRQDIASRSHLHH